MTTLFSLTHAVTHPLGRRVSLLLILSLLVAQYIVPSYLVGGQAVTLWQLETYLDYFAIPIHVIFFLFVGYTAVIAFADTSRTRRDAVSLLPVTLLAATHVVLYGIIPVLYLVPLDPAMTLGAAYYANLALLAVAALLEGADALMKAQTLQADQRTAAAALAAIPTPTDLLATEAAALAAVRAEVARELDTKLTAMRAEYGA